MNRWNSSQCLLMSYVSVFLSFAVNCLVLMQFVCRLLLALFNAANISNYCQAKYLIIKKSQNKACK